MTYTVKEVATMSGVSVRTLRYYDEIGLLKPAFYGENSYRYYEQEQLLRLQQILFFRELGFQLDNIQQILASDQFDQVETLHSHKHLLQQEMARIGTLLQTIDKTIHHLRGEMEMNNQEMYEGFDRVQQEKYEQELKDRYGKMAEEKIKESHENIKNWKKADYEDVRATFNEIRTGLTVLLEKGGAVDSPAVQQVIQKHYELISRFYLPTKEIYSNLGQLYTGHPDFRKQYDAHHPQLAEYMWDAMKHYAEQNL